MYFLARVGVPLRKGLKRPRVGKIFHKCLEIRKIGFKLSPNATNKRKQLKRSLIFVFKIGLHTTEHTKQKTLFETLLLNRG